MSEQKPRTITSPEQRAKAALANANARLGRAERARDHTRRLADEAQWEFERLTALADYAAKHPDLPR